MRTRLQFAIAALALAVPATAAAGGSFVVVSDESPPTSSVTSELPSALAPNAPGQIAVDADFRSPPAWVEQRSVEELQSIWERAGAAYGIRWEVLAAINKIESNFGGNMGPSSAGAVGWMQFMPDTWLRWGLDANADGVADPWNPEDAIFASARYLAAAGGATDISRAIFAYNHADWYVTEVLTLANAYAGGTIDTSGFGVGAQPTIDLTAFEQRVAAASDALARAESAEQRLAPVVRQATTEAAGAQLLSDVLLAQKHMTIIGVRYDRARTNVDRLRDELADAEQELERARAGVLSTPLQLVAASPFAAPPIDGFVLPPGGGTANVPAAKAVSFALAQLGTPYRWGAVGPYSFDCSGLTQAAYLAAGISLPRVAQQQYDAGPSVPAGEPLQPGDLVFFGSDASHVGHMGIVASQGLMIDAPHTGAVVRFDSYERSSYVGATRPAATGAAFPAIPATEADIEFATAEPAGSLTAGEILFTKNP